MYFVVYDEEKEKRMYFSLKDAMASFGDRIEEYDSEGILTQIYVWHIDEYSTD